MNIGKNDGLFNFMWGHASWAEDESDELYMAALYDAVECYCETCNNQAGRLVCVISLDDDYSEYMEFLEGKKK